MAVKALVKVDCGLERGVRHARDVPARLVRVVDELGQVSRAEGEAIFHAPRSEKVVFAAMPEPPYSAPRPRRSGAEMRRHGRKVATYMYTCKLTSSGPAGLIPG